MTGVQALLARTVLGVSSASAGLVLVSARALLRFDRRTFDRAIFAAYCGSRIALYSIVFWVLHIEPRGDIPAFYLPEARAVLQGAMPYRDFLSSYGPLHAYMDAAVLYVWNSPLALILFAIVIEAALLPLWLRLGRRIVSEGELRIAAVLYLTCPMSLQFVAIDGQDSVLIALFVALAVLCLYARRSALSGVLMGMAVVLVKFLALLFVPAFVMAAPQRWRWLAGLAVALVLGYGAFAISGAPLATPLRYEASLRTAGNLPYVVEGLLGVTLPNVLLNAIAALAIGLLVLKIASAAWESSHPLRLDALVFTLPALTLTLVLFSKKSWPPYLMLVLFPVCLLVSREHKDRISRILFAIFGVVAVTSHSYWSSIFGQGKAPVLHRMLLAGDPTGIVTFVLELLLLAGYVWLLYAAVVRVLRIGGTAEVAVPSLETA